MIPAYKAEEFLELSIESALAQTWANKEIIVVDDGSRDESYNIANQFASSGVKIHRQKNAGVAAVQNKAFELSKGDYIQWLDADDLLHPEKISLQMNRLRERVMIVHSLRGREGHFFFREEKARFEKSPLWSDVSPEEWLMRKMETGAQMQTATWLVSREITDAAGSWAAGISLDDHGEYFCRVLLQSSRVCFIDGAKVYYRSTGTESLSYGIGDNKKLDSLFDSIKLHVEYMLSLNASQRAKRALVTYLQKYVWDFHPERPDLVDKLKSLASSCDSELKPPASPRKYWLLEKLLGWKISKRSQIILPNLKTSFLRGLDKRLYGLRAK